MKYIHRPYQSGFTLIEISIGLVIIGLLIAGIVTGRSMIEAAETRMVISEVTKIETQINTFKTKFNHLPGDMPNAESFWGSDSNCPNTGANYVLKVATCNGNADGKIGTSVVDYEVYRAWQHIANAGLIDGQFSGVRGGDTPYDCRWNINCPSSRVQGAGYKIVRMDQAADWNHFTTPDANYLQFGTRRTNVGVLYILPLLPLGRSPLIRSWMMVSPAQDESKQGLQPAPSSRIVSWEPLLDIM